MPKPGRSRADALDESTVSRAGHPGLLLIDAHVHVYACFAMPGFLHHAWENFQAAGSGRTFAACLLLTETDRDHWFAALAERAASEPAARLGGWGVRRTAERSSLLAENSQGQRLYLIAGRQIVTRERMEVLAIGTDRTFRDGASLEETIDSVAAVGALPVIPWGFGKWLGHRGTRLSAYLERVHESGIFLGDNAGRPWFWPRPAQFALARRRAIPILPGSDPLPFASEFDRAGRYGFELRADLDPETPTGSVLKRLREPPLDLRPFGRRETFGRFLRNQLRMQLRLYRGTPGDAA